MYSSKRFAALCSCWLFILDMGEKKEGLASSGLVVEAFKIHSPSLFEPSALFKICFISMTVKQCCQSINILYINNKTNN